jgi:hypothetical protein
MQGTRDMKQNKDYDDTYRSNCHNAPVYVVSGDEGTNHYNCDTCSVPCEFHFKGYPDEDNFPVLTEKEIRRINFASAIIIGVVVFLIMLAIRS